MKITNTFTGGKMNMDLDQRFLPKGEYYKGQNIEVFNPENNQGGISSADAGALRNSLGNKRPVNGSNVALTVKDINNNALVNAKCIGAVVNDQANSIYFLITSTNEDLIVEYLDTPLVTPTGGTIGTAGAISYIARAPKPTVGGRYFNFNSSYVVTGINYINGFLMWTDNLNPPRIINVNTFKNYTSLAFAWNQDDINVIVRPPLTAPTIELSTSGVEGNYISEKFLYFSYRYKYTDGRWSSMSPFSRVAFTPSIFSYNAYLGYNAGMVNANKSVNITVATGDRQVTDIQFLFKDSSQPNIYVIETVNKLKPIITSSSIPNNSTWTYSRFDNSKIYASLPSSQLTRLFDNVPIKALAQDVVGSRLIYGNYTQYYNMTTISGSQVIPNFTIQKVAMEISPVNVEPSLKTNRDYEFGLIYLDDYGRMSTVITSPSNTCRIGNSISNAPVGAGNPKLKNYVDLSIFHAPPFWATKYRVAIKQSAGEYYNIFPLSVVPEGIYSWYRLSSGDKNKVNEGDYVIIKSTYDGITYSDQEYRVIEVGYKDIGGIFSVSGLYMKIAFTTVNANPGTNIYAPTNIFNGDPSAIWRSAVLPVDYSPVVFYPLSAVSYRTFAITYTLSVTVTRDYRLYFSYEGINSSGQQCLSYRVFGTSQNINPSPIPFRSSTGVPIQVDIYLTPYTSTPIGPIYGKMSVSGTLGINTGDSWRLNLYSPTNNPKTVGGASIKNTSLVIPANTTSTGPIIYAGAEINFGTLNEQFRSGISIVSPQLTSPPSTFISPSQYTDIQEWFWESGAYNQFYQIGPGNVNLGSKNVFFRYASSVQTIGTPFGSGAQITLMQGALTVSGAGNVYMCITTGMGAPPPLFETAMFLGGIPTSAGGFSISFQRNLLCIETSPKVLNDSVFHECTEDLSIYTNPLGQIRHGGNVQNQTNTLPAIVTLKQSNLSNTNHSFNCWAFPNGVESDRIKDQFNAPTTEWSPRVLVSVEDYGQQVVAEGLTYSGVYRQDSNTNNLNQFNLSLGNFKYLDKSFGSIQKIKSRDTDVVVFQQDQVSKVLFGKNLLSDSTGGGQVASVPEVLGTQIPYQGEFGISNNPESFAQWGDDMYFTDSQRGAVLRLSNNGMFDVSNNGMKSFFNNQFKAQPDTLKLGVVDPYYKRYIVSETGFTKSISVPAVATINDPMDNLPATVPVYDNPTIIISASGGYLPS